MGRLIERDLEGEMMAKIKVLFGKALESVNKDYPTSSFGFEQIVDGLDENDYFINDIFNFLVKEAAQRYRAAHPYDIVPRPATIHHYLPQNSTSSSSSSPSSSPSNSLSASLSSLAFSSRLLRHQQLVRSLLSEDDDTDLGSDLRNADPRRPSGVQGVPTGESNSRPSSTSSAVHVSPNLNLGSSSRLGGTLPRSSERAFDEDSDSEEDAFISSRVRRQLRDSDAVFAARVAIQAEMRSRQSAADVFSEQQPFYRPLMSISSPLSYGLVPPRTGNFDWGSGSARRHGISAPMALHGESTERPNEDIYADTLNRQRRLHFLRQLQTHLPSRRRGNQQQQQPQQQQPQPQQQQAFMMSRVLPINSGPVSIPAGSLIPGDDGGLGIMQSSATRNLRPVFASSTRLPDDQTPSLVSNIATSSSTLTATPPGVSEATNPTSLQLPELQQDPNLHIPPVFAQSQSVTLDQTPSELSTPSSDVYHEFVDATHRARAAMRAVDLAMDEIQSMRRRTLNVVGRFVSILDDTEQTGDASLTTGLQGPPAPTVAQPLMAVANEAGDMIPSTLQSDSQSISGHSAGSELNPHTTMDPNNSDTLTQHAVASTSESAFVGSSHSSSSLPTGQSQ